ELIAAPRVGDIAECGATPELGNSQHYAEDDPQSSQPEQESFDRRLIFRIYRAAPAHGVATINLQQNGLASQRHERRRRVLVLCGESIEVLPLLSQDRCIS